MKLLVILLFVFIHCSFCFGSELHTLNVCIPWTLPEINTSNPSWWTDMEIELHDRLQALKEAQSTMASNIISSSLTLESNEAVGQSSEDQVRMMMVRNHPDMKELKNQIRERCQELIVWIMKAAQVDHMLLTDFISIAFLEVIYMMDLLDLNSAHHERILLTIGFNHLVSGVFLDDYIAILLLMQVEIDLGNSKEPWQQHMINLAKHGRMDLLCRLTSRDFPFKFTAQHVIRLDPLMCNRNRDANAFTYNSMNWLRGFLLNFDISQVGHALMEAFMYSSTGAKSNVLELTIPSDPLNYLIHDINQKLTPSQLRQSLQVPSTLVSNNRKRRLERNGPEQILDEEVELPAARRLRSDAVACFLGLLFGPLVATALAAVASNQLVDEEWNMAPYQRVLLYCQLLTLWRTNPTEIKTGDFANYALFTALTRVLGARLPAMTVPVDPIEAYKSVLPLTLNIHEQKKLSWIRRVYVELQRRVPDIYLYWKDSDVHPVGVETVLASSLSELNILMGNQFADMMALKEQVLLTPVAASEIDEENAAKDCLICKCPMGRENVVRYPCGHLYHRECAESALAHSLTTCSACRSGAL